MGRFHFGLCEWALDERGKKLCKIVKEAGFESLQLGIGEEALDGEGLICPGLQREYMEAAGEYGIGYTSISMTVLDHISMCKEDEEARKKAMGLILRGIDIAQKMGIGMVMCPSFNQSEINSEGSFEKTVGNYKELCTYAAQKGIVVATENNMMAEDMIRLIQEVGRENFKIYFDSQNHYLKYGLYTPDLYDAIKEYVSEIHVKDGKGKQLSGALLGEGDTDFYETARRISESGYRGYIVIENYYTKPPLAEGKKTAAQLLKKDLETLQAVFGESSQVNG